MTKPNFAQGRCSGALVRVGRCAVQGWPQLPRDTPRISNSLSCFKFSHCSVLPAHPWLNSCQNKSQIVQKKVSQRTTGRRQEGRRQPFADSWAARGCRSGWRADLGRGSSSNCLYFAVGMFFPPLTLQPWVHYSSYEIEIMEKNGSVHLLGTIMCQVLNWEGNFKTILLMWVTGVSYQEPCQRHCSWQETYSIFMILPFTKPRP